MVRYEPAETVTSFSARAATVPAAAAPRYLSCTLARGNPILMHEKLYYVRIGR